MHIARGESTMNEADQVFELKCFYCDGVLAVQREGTRIMIPYARCPHCGEPITIKVTPDPQTQCGNCHEYFQPEDRYCRFCGTKRGEGAYDPYPEIFDMEEIYGPMPTKTIHVCKQCGYIWNTCLMVDRARYCPKCGGEVLLFYDNYSIDNNHPIYL